MSHVIAVSRSCLWSLAPPVFIFSDKVGLFLTIVKHSFLKLIFVTKAKDNKLHFTYIRVKIRNTKIIQKCTKHQLLSGILWQALLTISYLALKSYLMIDFRVEKTKV